jgi:hypothetical protein
MNLVVATDGCKLIGIYRNMKAACKDTGINISTAYKYFYRNGTNSYTSKTGITLTKTELK